MTAEFYTYFHTRNDTNAVFYVGKGKGNRAHAKGRNQHWRRIAAKHGHTTHIAARWPTEEEAFAHEKLLILCFRDLGADLANMTDGGEGVSGWIPSEKFRQSVSEFHAGRKRSQETRERLSAANKIAYAKPEVKAKLLARINSDEFKAAVSLRHKGKVVSEETRAKHRASALKQMADPAARENLSAKLIGKKRGPISEEHKAKIGAKIKGLLRSEETKARMSASAKASWTKRKSQVQ